MDMLSKVIVLYLWILCERASGDGYTWDVPIPLAVSICSEATNTLYLNWTYTPATPIPFFIQWSRVDASGSAITIARFSGSPKVFTPQGAYVGRVSRAGSTAEIALTGPFTADDAGMYKVSVTDSSGSSLNAEENVLYANVTQEPIKITSNPENTFDASVTCSLGSAANLRLELWEGDTRLQPDATTTDAITKTIPSSSGRTLKCSVTGQGSDCRTSNVDYVTLPVSSFVTASIIVVAIMIIIQLVVVLLVACLFQKSKILRIAAIIWAIILILISVIFIGLIAAKCNGASSEGIFIGAVSLGVLGLVSGIAVLVVLLVCLKFERHNNAIGKYSDLSCWKVT